MLLLLLLVLGPPAVVQAQFNYEINSGTITITGYTGSNSVMIIPDTINGLPVTSIKDETFNGCGRLTSVTIGTNVTSIGGGAFYGCPSLTSVTIPKSVISIGMEAFASCTSLTAITVDINNPVFSSVNAVLIDKSQTTLVQFPAGKPEMSYTIPNSVTSIGDFAFEGCTSLTNVTIPNSVTSIGWGAFENCSGLTCVTIGNSVTSIGEGAFEYCTSLTSVTIPDSVTVIKGLGTPLGPLGAFGGCTSLTNVTIGNTVTNIGDYAFDGCTSLANVTIGNSVTSIGGGAFAYCTSLTRVTIPNSVTDLKEARFDMLLYGPFYSCTSLTNVTIGNSVTSIGDYSFFSCTSLTSITIPNSVTNIGVGAFAGCTSLTGMTAEALNSAYISVNGVLFNKSQTTLIQFPAGKAGNSYTIPNSVTSIGDWAFAYCTGLTSITIPSSVTNIGNEQFQSSTNLTGVYFKGNAPSVGGWAFFQDNNVTAYYLPGTTGWVEFSANTDLPVLLWNPQVQSSGASFGVRTNRFGFKITGTADIPILVEACTNLASASWTSLQSCTITNGSIYFSDPQWTNYPCRFYRLRSP
jgi:hypothetical protein